jgi:hypothetical protein
MTSLTLLGDTSGSIVLDAPAVSGSTTITFAAQSGTLNVGGPAFSAYQNATQSISSSVETKIQFNVEDWDTANCYNTSTYRFTPNVAGYYQINLTVSCQSFSGATQPSIWKNGSPWMYGPYPNTSSGVPNWAGLSGLVYFNGSTDYIEAYFFSTAASTLQGNSLYRFQGFLARSA